ncbi:pfs domain-containing protein [Colletotrichum karsti]|uniref:Pfs domain-containing protein n=1 Tax=Colletotrichum karsti TaxID=1095194 RepID=A0A9P6LHK9_9PEZI|nr:pfs domain-containing protein [Colletotrichum karsti]KAF9876389.1 pfs domain-containing protein [Colletotrichum karsti]
MAPNRTLVEETLTDDIRLASEAYATFQDITQILRSAERDNSLKVFYFNLRAYCFMIRSHLDRISQAVIRTDHEHIRQALGLLESTIVLDSSSAKFSTGARLRAFMGHWNSGSLDDKSVSLQLVRSNLDFGKTAGERDGFLLLLAAFEEELGARWPEQTTSWTAEEFVPPKNTKISEPSYAVWEAAQSMFNALVSCGHCPCEPAHEFGARLCLGTYRRPLKTECEMAVDSEHGFDMFLSMKHDWHEARVHMAKEQVVRFDDGPRQPQQRARRPKVQPLKVKSLCEPITKINDMKAYRLELKVMREKLFRLKPERKRIAIFHGKDKTNPSRDSKLSCPTLARHTMAQIHMELVRCIDDLNEDDFDPDDLDGLIQHHCPTLVTLAIMLMEVYFVTPFDVLARNLGVMLEEGDEQATDTRYINADLVFQACRGEIPEDTQFYHAVEKCLDPEIWEDENGDKLDSETLRSRIYEEVVRPLEIELSQAYSSISIEDLDRFAQSLDFASWDQSIQNFGQQTAPDTSVDEHTHEQTNTPSPGVMYPFRTPDLPDPRSHLYSPGPPDWPHQYGRHGFASPFNLSPYSPPMESAYQSFKFFDDETIPWSSADKAHTRYVTWKSGYREVYDKFIPSELATLPVRVAVLDTGIDLTHPDVEARIENIKGTYNWLAEKHKKKVHDRNGHGTFTACLILDYAPDAELYVAKIAEKDPSNPTTIAKAINHAVTEWKVDIISMSFGFPDRDIEGYVDLENALGRAYANNVVLLAAASNSGGKLGRSFPAREPTVIAVHATDTDGNRSKFSPTAADFDINLATVGEAVESAWPVVLCDDDTDYVRLKSGTSYATPIMAGITAFLMLYARVHLPEQAHYVKKQKAVKALLRRLAEKGPGYKSRDDYHFVNLSLYSDNLFGKGKDFIDETIKDILRST